MKYVHRLSQSMQNDFYAEMPTGTERKTFFGVAILLSLEINL
jgi:hypothetical protein